MEYDEIDDYVNQLFDKEPSGNGTKGNGLNGEVLSGDWRTDRIDQVIEDTYNEAIWWHNHRISEGCDPRSGLRNLPYVPWDEAIDGVAAMQGAIGGLNESSFDRHGGHLKQYATHTKAYIEAEKHGLSCGEALLIVGAVVACILFMMVMS